MKKRKKVVHQNRGHEFGQGLGHQAFQVDVFLVEWRQAGTPTPERFMPVAGTQHLKVEMLMIDGVRRSPEGGRRSQDRPYGHHCSAREGGVGRHSEDVH